MKVKPNQKILFYDGTPLLDENKKEILVRDAIINAINAIDSSDENVDKGKIFEISMKMYKNEEEIELSVEDRAFILKRAEKTLIPVVYGRIKEILET